MLKEGIQLQNMLLYLRMRYYKEISIDKTKWLEGITDPRLNAALLPLQAIGNIEPAIKDVLRDVAKNVERLKIQQKASSDDGSLVNLLWEKIDDGLFECWNSPHYYLLASMETENIGKVEFAKKEPMTTSMMAEELKWTTKHARKVLNSLNICAKGLPPFIKVRGKSFRVIFFAPDKLEKRLREFVVGYNPRSLYEKMGLVTEVAEVTDHTHGG
jgi:hypothetical protein